MVKKREIDERDIDRLLSALTDLQIAELFGMTETAVFRLRQERRSKSKQHAAPPGQGEDQET